jgi:hypothetical protein
MLRNRRLPFFAITLVGSVAYLCAANNAFSQESGQRPCRGSSGCRLFRNHSANLSSERAITSNRSCRMRCTDVEPYGFWER